MHSPVELSQKGDKKLAPKLFFPRKLNNGNKHLLNNKRENNNSF